MHRRRRRLGMLISKIGEVVVVLFRSVFLVPCFLLDEEVIKILIDVYVVRAFRTVGLGI
jgi:hypothetical protein